MWAQPRGEEDRLYNAFSQYVTNQGNADTVTYHILTSNGEEILDSSKLIGGTWTRSDRTYTLSSTPVTGQELHIDVNRKRLLKKMNT